MTLDALAKTRKSLSASQKELLEQRAAFETTLSDLKTANTEGSRRSAPLYISTERGRQRQ